jgi:hypothetical protein
MADPLLYCSFCMRHTPHVNLPTMYATACKICGTHTSSLIRSQAEAAAPSLTAPDGTKAVVVENDTKTVTFYVPTGPHRGYYHYDKQTGKRSIVAD